MIKTNYYAIQFNRFLKHRITFVVTSSIMFNMLLYKIAQPVLSVNKFKHILKLDFNIKIPININAETMSNLHTIFYVVSIIGALAFFNNIYERFFIDLFQKESEVKWYDVKNIPYPYDHNKQQLILGLVHEEESLDLKLKPHYQVISADGMYQNLLIIGTIGTGKTACAISQTALQLIYMFHDNPIKKAALLFLDVKGTFYQFVYAFAKECNRWDDVVTIELGGKYKYNPLHKPNLTEIELANRIRYVLELLSSGGGGSEEYWIGKAEEMIREVLKLIRIYNDGYVNFEELHKMSTDDDYRNSRLSEIKVWLESEDESVRRLNDDQKYNFITSYKFFRDEFDKLDEKAQGYIKSEITRMTSPFISTKLVKDTFCPSKDEITFDGFEDVLKKGKIVVWKINANKEPKVAKLMAAYLKLDYQKEIMITLEKKHLESGKVAAERLKAIVCDEYQEYCTKNDPDFYAQSREPRCCTVCATQSYSSLKSALHNDDTKTSILLQSLVNKIWLRCDDIDYTIKKIIAQVGKVERTKVTVSVTESSRSSSVNYTLGRVIGKNKNVSSSENIQTVKEDKYEVDLLSHKLSLGQAVCFISDGKYIKDITIVHLNKMFEGRLICEGKKIIFTEDKSKIFKNFTEDELHKAENTTIDVKMEVQTFDTYNIQQELKSIVGSDEKDIPKANLSEPKKNTLTFIIDENLINSGSRIEILKKENETHTVDTSEDEKDIEKTKQKTEGILRDF